MLKKLAQKIGFLETELKVILFLASTFVLGLVAKNLINPDGEIQYNDISYAHEDSLFKSANFKSAQSGTTSKNIDYKQEVLDFRKGRFNNYKNNPPKLKSVNINEAGKNELIKLPGIGEKTAQRIINFRTISGNFKTLKEIEKVKGIGNKKFDSIKKYIYIK